MTDTIVSYHADGYAAARPAVDVKVHAAGLTFWPDGWTLTEDRPLIPWNGAKYVDAAYERVQSDFWQAAEEIATQRGLGEIEQEGRSGGWLVFTDGRDPQVMEDNGDTEAIDWLRGYRSMVEWADAFIADAPRKVRDLAQQLAMDEAGEPAALRYFAYDRTGPEQATIDRLTRLIRLDARLWT